MDHNAYKRRNDTFPKDRGPQKPYPVGRQRAAHTDKAHIRDYPLPVPHIYSREATLHNQGLSSYCIMQSHTFNWLLGGHMTSKYESSIPSTKASKREAF